MEDLINNASTLFDDRSVNNSSPEAESPPLPPTPPGEPVPSLAYGSSHTRFASIPPASSTQQSDFGPPLPPRPPNSIHSSRRPVPLLMSGARADLPSMSSTASDEDDPPSPCSKRSQESEPETSPSESSGVENLPLPSINVDSAPTPAAPTPPEQGPPNPLDSGSEPHDGNVVV
jgi:hypothetical protein